MSHVVIDDENITRDLKIEIVAGQESKFAHDVFNGIIISFVSVNGN
jgi:hypothetical protein